MNENRAIVARRTILKGMGFAAAGAVGGLAVKLTGDGRYPDNLDTSATGRTSSSRGRTSTTVADQTSDVTQSTTQSSAPPEPVLANPDPASRILVVVQMFGGNDGLNTLVPFTDDAYYAARPSQAIPADEALNIDGTWGLHPAMTNLYGRGGAYLLGVGITDPDVPNGSHFTMQQRWLDGDPAGEGKDTGIFGRLCDAVHNPDAMVTGCSVFAPTRSMLANQATTVSLPDPGAAWFLDPTNEDRFVQAYQGGLLALGRFSEADTGSFVAGRKGIRDAYGLGSLLFDLPDAYDQYPGDELGRSLAYVGRLIAADQGIRVIQVEFDGNFDSHSGHRGSHDGLMAGLDAALGVFFTDLDQRGMADRVMVMTTSEFGRRLDENASQGLDHGTASVGMMFGPVNPGVYGEPPSLTALTDGGELAATTSFANYYATAAAPWLGIDPAVVHPGATPIDGIVAT